MRSLVPFIALTAMYAATAATPIRIGLHAQLQAENAYWRVAEVVEMPADLRSTPGIDQLRLPAPLPGHVDRWRPEQLERLIRARTTGTLPTFNWQGATELVVTRRVEALAGDELVAAAIEAWRQARQSGAGMLPEAVAAVLPLDIPTGAYRLRARRIASPEQGSVVVWIDVLSADRVVRSASIGLRDRALHAVYVARRALDAGETVHADDFRRTDIEGGAPASTVPGQRPARLRHALREGEVLSAGALLPAGAVRRGDLVQVVLRQRGLQLEMRGTAAGDAQPGQSLAVQWEQGHELVRGRLLDDGRVAVE